MRTLTLLTFLVLLNSCFLDQNPPDDTKPHKEDPTLTGVLNLFDQVGPTAADSKAYIAAGFAEKKANATTLKVGLSLLFRSDFDMDSHFKRNTAFLSLLSMSSAKAAECRTVKKNLGEEQSLGVVATALYLPAGKLDYGLEGISSLTEIPHDEKNVYYKEVPILFQAGNYQIRAEGSSHIPAFVGVFSVPEVLVDVRINSSLAPKEIAMIKKGEDLIVEWQAPAYLNSTNIMVMELVANGDKEQVLVQCSKDEALIYQGTSRIKWTIPASAFADLPVSEIAAAFIQRVEVGKGKKGNLEVTLLALRELFSQARVE